MWAEFNIVVSSDMTGDLRDELNEEDTLCDVSFFVHFVVWIYHVC